MEQHSGHSIAKNTSYLTIAFIIQKILSFFYYTFLAHSLEPDQLGKYTFAILYSSIFVIFMDFGLGPILTREVARNKEKLRDILEDILGIKLILVIGSLFALYGTFFILRSFRDIPLDTVNLVYLASLVIVLDTFTFTFFSIFRAYQVLIYEAIGVVIYQIIIITVGIAALGSGLPVAYAVFAVICGSLFHFSYSSFLIFKRLRLSPNLRFSPSRAKTLLKISAPFALAGIFFKLNGSVDTVMLEFLASERYVAWYGIALKLTTALTVLPGAFATSFFPAMSYYYKHDREKLTKIFERSMFYLFAISLPIAAGTFVLSRNLILTIYPDVYEASYQSLQIFMISLFFVFINYPIGNLLNASDRQTRNTVNMGIAMLVNIILNIYFIPRHTFIGATIAAAISAFVLVCLGIIPVWRVIHFQWSYLLKKFVLTLLASLLMGISLFFLQGAVPLLGLFGLAAVLYVACLFIVRAITPSEIHALKSAIFHRKQNAA